MELEESSSLTMSKQDSCLLDLDENELQAFLSPRVNLKMLADTALQSCDEAEHVDSKRSAVYATVEERLEAGSSVTGCKSGTDVPGSSSSASGLLRQAGESGPSGVAAGLDTPREASRKRDEDSTPSVGGRESHISPIGRRSQRWDREPGCRRADVEPLAEERDDHATIPTTMNHPSRCTENLDTVNRVPDRGMSRNLKSYAVGTKLGIYDGNSSLETFLAKFDNCSDYFEWTEKDRLFQLRASLEGPAGQLLWSAPRAATVDVIIKMLRNRFGNLHQQERYRAELKSRRRRPNESLQSLYIDISRLMSLAYPGPSTPLADIVGRDAFLQALNNPAMCVRILEKEPVSLDDALNLASRLEAYDKCAGRYDQVGTSDADFAHVKPKYVKAAGTVESLNNQQVADKSSDVMCKQLEAMQQALERCHAELRSQSTELKAQRSEINSWHTRANSSSNYAPPSNFTHMATGITSNDAWPAAEMGNPATPDFVPPFDNSRSFNSAAKKRTGNCYVCGQPGHFARDHKKKTADNFNSPGDGGDARQARGISATQSPADVYLRIKLNGSPTFALLDTGCEQNICGRRLIPDLELTESSQRLFAANGTPIALLGQTVIKINVNGMLSEVVVVVSEAIDELILGIPFLVDHNCCWNFASSQIVIDRRSVRLYIRACPCSVRRIYAERDVVIPPASAIEIHVLITRPNLKQSGDLWAVELKCLGDGVLTARTLVAGSSGRSFLRVMNISENKCTIRRGKWAELKPCHFTIPSTAVWLACR